MKNKRVAITILGSGLILLLVAWHCLPPGWASGPARAWAVDTGSADEAPGAATAEEASPLADVWEEEVEAIADPLEPLNRAFFTFNDKLYFWLIKPLATVYAKAVPTDIRICIRNAFHNLLAPARIVNNLLQGKVADSGIELCRFAINSTFGIAGLVDTASDFKLPESDEDLGQTLGVYGAGPGIYLNWPILGPSSLRDSVGLVGDAFLDPVNYVTGNIYTAAGVYSGKRVNQASLTLGDYELFKETAIDPYAALRDAYHQYRQGRIRHRASEPEAVAPPSVSLAPQGGPLPGPDSWQSDTIGFESLSSGDRRVR